MGRSMDRNIALSTEPCRVITEYLECHWTSTVGLAAENRLNSSSVITPSCSITKSSLSIMFMDRCVFMPGVLFSYHHATPSWFPPFLWCPFSLALSVWLSAFLAQTSKQMHAQPPLRRTSSLHYLQSGSTKSKSISLSSLEAYYVTSSLASGIVPKQLPRYSMVYLPVGEWQGIKIIWWRW